MRIIMSVFFIIFSINLKAIELGPFEVSYTFCKDVQKIGSILNAFQITQWPVAGLPGMVIGISQRTSPIVDMCSYIVQVKSADTADAIFMSAEKANDLLKAGFDKDLEFSKAAFNLANSQYDFNKGKQRPAALDAVYTASRIGNFMKSLGKYQNAKRAQEYDTSDYDKVNELAKLSRERAIIQDQTTCPEAKSNKDYSQTYKNEYEPALKKFRHYEQDVNFIVTQLNQMGPRFIRGYHPTQEEKERGKTEISADVNWARYDAFITKMVNSGVTYKSTIKKEQVPSSQKTKEKNNDGTFKIKKINVEKKSQQWAVSLNSGVFSEFSSNYGSMWREWLHDYWEEGVKEFNGTTKLQNEFFSISPNCNPTILAGKNYDPVNPIETEELNTRIKACQKDGAKEVRRSDVANYISLYVKDLQKSLYEMKVAQAKLWTLDSYYLGRHRSVSVSTGDLVSSEEVVCSETLSIADINQLSLKLSNLNSRYNQEIAENAVKQTMIEEERMKAEQEEKRKLDASIDLSKRKNEQDMRNLKKIPKSTSF